jgi:hypothetical protein
VILADVLDQISRRWDNHPNAAPLRLAVEVGVPCGSPTKYQCDERTLAWLLDRARWAAGMVAAHGDILQYRTRAQSSGGGTYYPSTAEVCTALVDGAACCALVARGGSHFLGLHFDADIETAHPEPRSPKPTGCPSS